MFQNNARSRAIRITSPQPDCGGRNLASRNLLYTDGTSLKLAIRGVAISGPWFDGGREGRLIE